MLKLTHKFIEKVFEHSICNSKRVW